MNLDEYLSLPDAPTAAEFRRRMAELGYDVKSDAQVRQWRYRYSGRIPSAENCTGIWLASEKRVSRESLRPDDYWLIWPELPAPAKAQNHG